MGQKGQVHCVLGGSQKRGPCRADPWLTKLATGTCNVTSLAGKESELVRDVERYRLDIVRLTSMHRMGSGTNFL